DLADPFHPAVEVRLELLAQLFTGGLVRRIVLVPKGEARVVHPREIFRVVGGEQAFEEVYDPPGRGSVLTSARRERPRDEGKERPVDERVAVDEEKPRGGRERHLRKFTRTAAEY